MDSACHGPGGDESKDSKSAGLAAGGVKNAEVQGSDQPVAKTDGAGAAKAQDEGGKKEAGQGKAQQQQLKPALKKPDKLAPCPRCDSLDTKFCYYNNYNVNQPRHFCKNCQRYWTAGGTLRNVPVGAGRRKNKHGSLHARHASMPDPAARLDLAQPRPCLARGQSAPEPRPPLHVTSASSGVVSSIPSCQERRSSESVTQTGPLSVEHEKRPHIPEPQMSVSSDQGGSRSVHTDHGGSSDPDADREPEKDDCEEPCTSSAPASPSHHQQETPATAHELQGRASTTPLQPVCAGVIRPVGLLDGSGLWTAAPTPFGLYNSSWPYGYNVGWSGPPPGAPICPPGGTLVTCQPGVGGLTAWPAPPNGLFCWGSTIIPGMPPGLAGPSWMAPGWGGGVGGGWSLPWAGAAGGAGAGADTSSPSMALQGSIPGQLSTGSGSKLPIRPVLSKHPRDRLELERVESSLWVPKMVRLDDPGNVSRSSVWTAVGGGETRLESSSVTSGSNFKAFLPMVGDDDKASVTSGDQKQENMD